MKFLKVILVALLFGVIMLALANNRGIELGQFTGLVQEEAGRLMGAPESGQISTSTPQPTPTPMSSPMPTKKASDNPPQPTPNWYASPVPDGSPNLQNGKDLPICMGEVRFPGEDQGTAFQVEYGQTVRLTSESGIAVVVGFFDLGEKTGWKLLCGWEIAN